MVVKITLQTFSAEVAIVEQPMVKIGRDKFINNPVGSAKAGAVS